MIVNFSQQAFPCFGCDPPKQLGDVATAVGSGAGTAVAESGNGTLTRAVTVGVVSGVLISIITKIVERVFFGGK